MHIDKRIDGSLHFTRPLLGELAEIVARYVGVRPLCRVTLVNGMLMESADLLAILGDPAIATHAIRRIAVEGRSQDGARSLRVEIEDVHPGVMRTAVRGDQSAALTVQQELTRFVHRARTTPSPFRAGEREFWPWYAALAPLCVVAGIGIAAVLERLAPGAPFKAYAFILALALPALMALARKALVLYPVLTFDFGHGHRLRTRHEWARTFVLSGLVTLAGGVIASLAAGAIR